MHYIPYNSMIEYHKQPFGAVPDGTTVTFRVILPRNICCTGVRLVIREDSQETESRYTLEWERMEGNGEEWWKICHSLSSPGLYWYTFEYSTVWGVSTINRGSDGFGQLSGFGTPWQLTVYDRNFVTPDWIKGGVIYQIFPDRFFCSGEKKKNVPQDRILRNDFENEPMWQPDNEGKITRYDYFGGDLKGIEQKLPYLFEMGVTCIYLNPIFEAHSNHRYDTADYMRIDPQLGTEEDFSSLCSEAEKLGIKIILDGVFSHTGADSRYFNKFGRYSDDGAYFHKSSPYYPWYKFNTWPDDYVSWWGVDILPEINETEPSFLEFITGENGVARQWLRAGASGWRLDVADELPDGFLERFREAVKKEKPDAYILGEVWEDASNKTSYGERRSYLLGEQLDSVMNYPFASAIMEFLSGRNAELFMNRVLTVMENYPKPVIDALMNHIGTHDTVRAINLLSGSKINMKKRRASSLSDKKRLRGLTLMKTAAAIQYTLPGVPSVYYGDEAGLEGGADPFNRAFFPWGRENKELTEWYRTLGNIRRSFSALSGGSFHSVSAVLGCAAFERCDGESAVMTLANLNEHEISYYLPDVWHCDFEVYAGERESESCIKIPALSAAVLTRRISSESN